jgi:hypothetical protein
MGDSSSSPQHPVSGLQTASALPGASMRRILFKQGYRLGLITATLRFESPNNWDEELKKNIVFL